MYSHEDNTLFTGHHQHIYPLVPEKYPGITFSRAFLSVGELLQSSISRKIVIYVRKLCYNN